MAPRGRRGAPTGPAAMRHAKARTDKDGDLSMGSTTKARGGISKRGPSRTTTGRGVTKTTRFAEGRGKDGVNLSTPEAQRRLLSRTSDVNVRETRSTAPRQPVELKVSGWTKGKTSDNPDRGAGSLKSFLEKKASIKLGSKHNSIKIKQFRVEGDDMIIQVRGEEAGRFLRLDGWVFAGANITVKRIGDAGTADPQKEEATNVLKNFLDMRYNPDMKLLDLSAIGPDPLLRANFEHMNDRTTAWKLFAALMKVLGDNFENDKDKEEAIVSVTLANNDLPDLNLVSRLTSTLPMIRNLDLSYNKIESTAAVMKWRNTLPVLDQLVVTGNPLEIKEPEYPTTLKSAFRKLRVLNNIQIRTEAEVANGTTEPRRPFPFPPSNPVFTDEGQIVETFVRDFFKAFDTDRNALVAIYYDANSKFSFHANTAAPRDPTAQSGEKHDWTTYISASRNLRKVTQLPARLSREYIGQQSIAQAFGKIPPTAHPGLDDKKWMIESHLVPGVPDRSGRSTMPVDGFMIVVHGEFGEPSSKSTTGAVMRSFDRTFVLSPGGQKGVVVVSDLLVLRSYGGTQAFEPETAAPPAGVPLPGVPAGLDPAQAQQMCQQLQAQTGLNEAAVIDCLNQTGWNFAMALARFNEVKSQLPPAAFIQHN